ncbi:hypothetical protein [Allobaculum sp. JKK-2023]|uniref:hypothetical protein n=1 Tax=Allobaculum sp. JKK-2023 TaxID=3108943 RepID=UPI002B0569BE|nr:hypothetical protein [Allobaculum sp. JKK-2023]
MKINGQWIEQKLSQNGFTVQDLSDQSGLDVAEIQKMIETSEGNELDWNTVLSTLNQYPALYAPANDLLTIIEGQMEQSSADEPCTIFYGVNQSDLLFVAIQFSDLSVHGANVSRDYLHRIDQVSLGQAYALFQAQADAIANAGAKLKNNRE